MVTVSKQWWETLEQWRGTAFLLAAVVFGADAAIIASNVATGTARFMTVGQGLVGAAWTVAFLGLLGLYPGLAGRSRWLPRIGAVFAVVGVLTMAVMAVVSFGIAGGVLATELEDVVGFFLPGVFLGIVLGVGAFAVASLLTDVFARSLGLLLLLLVVAFLFNLGTGIAGFNPLEKVLGVVAVLVLATGAIGYLLRSGDAVADHEELETTGDSVA